MFWKYLVVFLIGFVVGYIIKDNLSKPDVSIENRNKIKQKGNGNILNFFQELRQNKQAKKALRKAKRKSKRD